MRDRRGTAAIEFSLLAAALIALCVGTIEVGLVFWGKSAVEAAAADTARCIAIASPACPDTSTAASYAAGVVTKWMFAGVVTAADVTVNDPVASCSGASGSFVEVQINSSYLADWLPSFVAPLTNKTLSATACYPK